MITRFSLFRVDVGGNSHRTSLFRRHPIHYGRLTLRPAAELRELATAACAFRGDEAHEQFRAFIMEELMALKNGLALATQAREQSDDEIIQVCEPLGAQMPIKGAHSEALACNTVNGALH